MLVTIHHVAGVSLDLPAEVTWVASVNRSHGSARLTIPRNSVAWSADVLSEAGGFLVTIQGASGVWRGIAERPEFTPEGMRLDAQSITGWLAIRRVAASRHFAGVTCGAVVRAALRDALSGSQLPIIPGAICEAPPALAFYEFSGQYLLDVLTAMSEWSGHEWHIDDSLRFHWLPRSGRHHETPLIDDGGLFRQLQSGRLADTYAEVTEVTSDGTAYTARAYDTPLLWPAQRTEKL